MEKKMTFEDTLDEVTKNVVKLRTLEDKFDRIRNVVSGWHKQRYSGDSAVSDINDILNEGANAN